MLLPEGWKSEDPRPRDPGRFAVITGPGKMGSVTVNFEKRQFAAGWSLTGPAINVYRYAGRKWRERLVDDAIRWLRDE